MMLVLLAAGFATSSVDARASTCDYVGSSGASWRSAPNWTCDAGPSADADGIPDATAFGLPAAKRCVSRRRFPIRLREPRGIHIRKARVTLNGKPARVRKSGGRFRATIDLRGLTKGSFTIAIRITTTDGRTVNGKRRYHTCEKRRTGRRPHV